MQDRPRSIRNHLLAVLATTLVVVVSLPLVSAIAEIGRAHVRAEADFLRTAALVSDEVARHMEYLERLLDALVRRGQSDLPSAENRCDIWRAAAEHTPSFAAAILSGRGGDPACDYRSPQGELAAAAYADHAWFQAAMSADSTSVRRLVRGRARGGTIAVLARRIPAGDGSALGATGFAVGLGALAETLQGEAPLSGTGRITIVTGDGTVLADWEGPDAVDASRPLELEDSASGGLIRTREGDWTLAAAGRFPHTDWDVYVGVPSDDLLAGRQSILLEHGLLALAGSAIIVVLAGVARWMAVAPLGELVVAVRAAVRGEANQVPSGPVEFRELATWLNAALAQRRRTESRLTWLSETAEQSAESIFITDRDGFFLYVNPAFERITGYAMSDLVGTTPRILRSAAHDDEFFVRLWATIVAGDTFRGVITNRTKSGETYLEDKVIAPIRNARGQITHFVSTGRDVTARATLESRLRQSERLAAVGRVAGGVAHDFNNLLTVIKGHARLLERHGPQETGSDWADSVQKIIEGTEMASNLTRELLTFGRNDAHSHEGTVLDEEAKKVRNILARILPADIELDMELSAPGAAVSIGHAHAGQILMNLSLNARDAMTERGGTLSIRTTTVHVPPKIAWERPGLALVPCVLLEVADTGQGMSAQVAENIFEPYYSTKETGSGLGLATVLGVVEDAGGVIDVQTTEGEGTRFSVYLPMRDTSPPPAASRRLTSSSLGSETVVVAEDEENVRRLITDLLERHGYHVIEAADGHAALTLVEELGGPVDLLVTDVMMPRMRGPELYRRLKTLYPDIRVLFTSGYAEGPDIAPEARSAGEVFLQKPFGPEELLTEVRVLLDEADG